MSIVKEILQKRQEFADLMKSVDMDALRTTHSRKELEAFRMSLQTIRIPDITGKLSQLTEDMKHEEYPQLKSVHHFPVINEIDFLTLPEKEALDNYLVHLRIGNLVFNFYEIIRNAKKLELLDDWLIANKVMEPVYVRLCPNCSREHISKRISEAEKCELVKDFNAFKDGSKKEYEDWSHLSERLYAYCETCDGEVDAFEADALQFNRDLRMVMERDTSLDVV